MASVGGTFIASHAGPSAQKNATTRAVAMAVRALASVSSTGPPAGGVERVDRFAHRADRALRQHPAQRHAHHRARHTEQQSLRQKDRQHGNAAGADSPQNADFGAPPHHADRNRVVDQEGSHQQRDVAEGAQIQPEGAQHGLVFLAAGARLFDQISRRQGGAKHALHTAAVLSVRHRDIDAVQLAVAIEKFLAGGDVHQQELVRPGALHRGRAEAVRVAFDIGLEPAIRREPFGEGRGR